METSVGADQPVKKIMIVSDAWDKHIAEGTTPDGKDGRTQQINGVVFALTSLKKELEKRGIEVGVVWPDPEKFRLHPVSRTEGIYAADTTNYANEEHKVREQIAAFKPDAIYVATPEGPIGMTACRFLNEQHIPYNTGYHTRFPEYVRDRFGVSTRATYPIARSVHGSAHKVMVPTQTMCDTLAKNRIHNTVIKTNGVDLSRFSPTPLPEGHRLQGIEGDVYLYVGRVSKEKNLEDFLNLDLPGTKVIVGDGPQREELQKKYPDAIFTGKIPQEDLAPYYTRADVFVFPSRSDTFGQVVIQALACGTPVAAYKVEGPQDIITDDKLGVLEESDLKMAVEKALKLGKSEELIRFRQEWMKSHYTWQRAADQLCENLAPIAPEKWEEIGQAKRAWEKHIEPFARGVRGFSKDKEEDSRGR